MSSTHRDFTRRLFPDGFAVLVRGGSYNGAWFAGVYYWRRDLSIVCFKGPSGTRDSYSFGLIRTSVQANIIPATNLARLLYAVDL